MDAGVSPQRSTAELVICGGGLAGAALACLLANRALRVTLLEATTPEAQARRVPRALALSWASRHILEACALWSQLATYVTPVREVQVAAPRRFGTLCFRAADLDAEALGFVIPEDRLLAAFWSCLNKADNINAYRPAEVKILQTDAHQINIRAQRPDQTELELNAQLLAGTDGAHSHVRELAGIAYRSLDYEQTALAMTARWDRDLAGAACERLTTTGPLAMLPTGGATCKLVYSLASSRAETIRALSADARLQLMQECLGPRYGRLLELGEPAAWPLVAREATGTAPRVALLGDAAFTVHPIAAQGFNRCLREVAAFADLLRAAPPGTDYGARAQLRAFEESARPDRQQVFGLTHCLARFLSVPAQRKVPGTALRPLLCGLGMTVLDMLPGVRQRFLHMASGRYGCQPAWTRGG